MRAWSCISLAVFLVACGDRTGLLVPDGLGGGPPGSSGSSGGSGSSSGSGSGSAGSGDNTADADVSLDALPPLDVTVPEDAFNDCPNAQATFIYVVTTGFELLSFYPPTAQFRTVGTLNCPTTMNSNPFSMAVDRTGIAYVLYEDGELFRVSTATASCKATGFVSGQGGFPANFGMGYSRDSQGTGETLYVAGSQTRSLLASIDTNTFQLQIIGSFEPAIQRAELTGTGGGDLFAFFASSSGTDPSIGQIDKTTGTLTNQATLTGLNQGSGWAFAFWGGDFYTFTAPSAGTVVTRFRPTDKSLVTVATRSDVVVGAGVSTCAPAQ